MADDSESRRSALKTMAWCIAAAAGLWRFLTPLSRGGAHARTITIAAADVPAEGALVLPELGVAVVRDGNALRAVELACTHLGCTVTGTVNGFACPCHGSRFDCKGERVSGPAAHALRARPVEMENGVVRVAAAEVDGEGRVSQVL